MNEQTIFTTALELEPSQRGAFLDEACGHIPELRKRVEELLQFNAGAGQFMEQPAAVAMATVAPLTTVRIGTQIGPYKLLQQIGEGGMGTVFMAEQTSPVVRRVAIKLIKSGMDSRQVIARFEAERQALAIMDHVNIARVFDAGTTEQGHPYFVMELVNGVPITKYCDDNHLTPRQRLELFVPVCQAIQHAHQKGIIHRDIKPSNVMVTLYDGKPVPKVIDFGVAKATEQKLTERTLFTHYGTMVGTLEYMSPEQAEMSALGVDTRSDIYSLGVLLYELLTGSTPLSHQRLKNAAYAEILRIIKEEDPPKPSTRLSDSGEALASISANRHTEPAKLTKLIRGELDWIVMKTLEKDRNRRYETANAFAMDVQRYLDDEPVQACPPSNMYRFRKFARRNKASLLTIASIGVALLLAVGSLGWTVRDRAARQANVAGKVKLILGEVDQLEREQKWSDALTAARRAEAAMAGGEADAETTLRVRGLLKDLEFIDRLEQIRMMAATLVDGKFNNAGADAEYGRAFLDYGVNVEDLAVETSIDRLKARPSLAIPLAAALDNWVFCRRNVSGRDSASWKQPVAIARGIDPEPLRNRLRSTWGLPASEVREELRRLAESIDIRVQHPATLVSLVRTLVRAGDSDSALRLLRDAQYVYSGDFWLNFELGVVLNQRKDHERAIRFYTAAISIRPNSAVAHYNLGTALQNRGEPDEAIACYRKAIELDPKCAVAYSNLGLVLCEQKKVDEAIDWHRKAIELAPRNAKLHNLFGSCLLAQGKPDDAIVAYRKAIELNSNDALAYSNLGWALMGQGKLDEAVTHYRKAIELDPKSANAYSNLGWILKAQGKLDEAVTHYRKAIELDDPQKANAHCNLGDCLRRQGKEAEAIAAYQKSLAPDPNLGAALFNLSGLLANGPDPKLRDPKQAIELVKRGMALNETRHDGGAAWWAILGGAHYRAGAWMESIAAMEKSMTIYPAGAEADLWLFLAMAHWQLGHKDEARQWYDRGAEWIEKNKDTLDKEKRAGTRVDDDVRNYRAEAAKLLGISERE